MIFGAYNPDGGGAELKQELLRVVESVPNIPDGPKPEVWADGVVALAWVPQGMRTLDEPGQPYQNESKTITMVFEGKIYNLDEIAAKLGDSRSVSRRNSGQVIVGL